MKGILYLMEIAHINNIRIVIEKDGMIYFSSNNRRLSLYYETIKKISKKDLEHFINLLFEER